jgi:predicted nucleotidyltransferase
MLGEPNIKFLVFGNIHAGKSTFIDSLKQDIGFGTVLSIDAYRQLYGDGTLAGEEKAIKNFLYDVRNTEHAIIEATGLGTVGQNLFMYLEDPLIYLIHVQTPLDVVLQRIRKSNKFDTPYPYQVETIEETAKRLDSLLKHKGVFDSWKKLIKQHWLIDGTMGYEQQIKDIPTHLFSLLLEKMSLYQFSGLIMVGSLAKGELTKTSDIDLIVPDKTLLYRLMDFDRMFSQPRLTRFNDRLIEWDKRGKVEVSFTDDLSEYKEYFRHPTRTQPKDWIIYGISHLSDKISPFLTPDPQFISNKIIDALKNIQYYYLSLPALKEKGDIYKFNFHLQILRHYYVVCLAVLNDKDHLYLPKMVHQYVPDSPLMHNVNHVKEMDNRITIIPNIMLPLIQKLEAYLPKDLPISMFTDIYQKENSI